MGEMQSLDQSGSHTRPGLVLPISDAGAGCTGGISDRRARCRLDPMHVLGTSAPYVFCLQNILKRTPQGSRDEDTATKAFNELKKVQGTSVPAWQQCLGACSGAVGGHGGAEQGLWVHRCICGRAGETPPEPGGALVCRPWEQPFLKASRLGRETPRHQQSGSMGAAVRSPLAGGEQRAGP